MCHKSFTSSFFHFTISTYKKDKVIIKIPWQHLIRLSLYYKVQRGKMVNIFVLSQIKAIYFEFVWSLEEKRVWKHRNLRRLCNNSAKLCKWLLCTRTFCKILWETTDIFNTKFWSRSKDDQIKDADLYGARVLGIFCFQGSISRFLLYKFLCKILGYYFAINFIFNSIFFYVSKNNII